MAAPTAAAITPAINASAAGLFIGSAEYYT
jgi:hypothetical protein